ncbi:MAG: 6-oxocyclohex-1-ene-1-carbonyl-CoA hydratase, partial [Deltaproteobacteria bacterium]
MALEWMPRDDSYKDHLVHSDAHWGTDEDAPCVVFEKRPLKDPEGNVVEGLYVAWVRLNNPRQYNSYTTE